MTADIINLALGRKNSTPWNGMSPSLLPISQSGSIYKSFVTLARGIARDMERERGGGGLEGNGAAATMTNVHAAERCSMQKICIARLLGYVTKGNEVVISL